MAKNSMRKAMLACGASLSLALLAAPAQAQSRSFDIPAQPATRSIPEFARQAGIQVIAPGASLRALRTPALRGTFDVRQALRILLEGTGLRIVSDEGSVITLRPAGREQVAAVGGAPEPAPALAAAMADEVASGDDIIVTGTLIRNPNLTAAAPVVAVARDEIELQQANIAEELLRDLPGAVPSIGSAVNNGNGGASFVNLRNLGVNRNVVLLDGYRIAPANFVGTIDLNNIPLALIQRVDVLTGGASTTYGADAVGGVVNFITRRDFTGVELNLSGQITERSDGERYRADLTVGASFDDGRGNVVLSVGYQKSEPVFQGDRAVSAQNVNPFNGVVGGGSATTVPGTFSFARAGIPATQPAPGLLTGNRQIDPALGAVRTTNPAIFSRFNFNPYNVFQTPFTRYNVFGQANYEIAEGIEVFTRGLFSKNSVSVITAPAGVFSQVVVIPVSNPFLPAGLRAQFCANNDFQHGGAAGSGARAGAVGSLATPGVQTLTPAECAAAALATNPNDPNYRTFTTTMSRRTTETGARLNEFDTTIFDYQIGLRGDLSEAISYELMGAYGESENRQTQNGFILTSRVRQSLLATSPTACLDTSNGCVPTNWFGADGTITPEAIAYLSAPSTSTNFTSLAQLRGTVDADTGFASPLAGETINVAAGAEYRRNVARIRSDLLARTPGELGGGLTATPDLDGALTVREVFGEVIAPLVEDRPFVRSLTLEAGARYSSYRLDAPGNPSFDSWTYKAGLQWVPVEGLRFRGQYSRAARAPNIGELFAPVASFGVPLNSDPCQGLAPTQNAELRAICLAQGAPVASIGGIEPPTVGVANALAGGNVDLRPEKADTYTLGFIFQPEFIPGLSLALDWFDIKVRGAVAFPTADDAILACFGPNPTTPPPGASTTPACTSIRRNPNTGALSGNPVDTPGLFLGSTNLGVLTNRGIDLSINYDRDLGFARLSLGFVGTYNNDSRLLASPTAIDRECAGFYSVNCLSIQPEFQFSQRTTLRFGNLDVSLLWRFLDKVRFEPVQFASDLEAALANGCADPAGADPNGCVVDPQFRQIRAYHYFDLSARYEVNEHLTFLVSVENLFDTKPPLTGTLIGSPAFNHGNTFPASYDTLGRRFAANVRLRF